MVHYQQGYGGHGSVQHAGYAQAGSYAQPPQYPQYAHYQAPQGYPPAYQPHPAHQPPPKTSSSKAGVIIAVIALMFFAVIGGLGAVGVYGYLETRDELSQYQSVTEAPGLKIPGGGKRNPSTRKDDVSYTYGTATEAYTTKFVQALRSSVQSSGWRFERNKNFDDVVVFDCTSPTGKRVGALITKDSQGRILLTLM